MTTLIDKTAAAPRTKISQKTALKPENYAPHASSESWSRENVEALFDMPFMDLILKAQSVHREHHAANTVQMSQLLSIKTGGCAEDCGYCNQSAHFDTGLKAEKLIDTDVVLAAARKAKAGGAGRFCMGAAWRAPKDRDMDSLCDMVKQVKDMGDTAPEDYDRVISTRTFEDRLHTLNLVRESGMKVCCGGIVGMGETAEDRIGLLLTLANLTPPPESVPINALVPVPGTPLGDSAPVHPIDFARVIAVARIMMPQSYVRLSAGRETMSDETQALCFLAGANSIFVGETLLTTDNPSETEDRSLFTRLGISAEQTRP